MAIRYILCVKSLLAYRPMLQVKIKFRLKLFNLALLSISFDSKPRFLKNNEAALETKRFENPPRLKI